MEKLIKKFSETSAGDTAEVGGKNASLGEMFSKLSSKGIKIPNGFATTALAFRNFLDDNKLSDPLQGLMKQLDRQNFSNLKEIGNQARELMLSGKIPQALQDAIH